MHTSVGYRLRRSRDFVSVWCSHHSHVAPYRTTFSNKMLLTAIPEDVRRDLISSRKLSTSEIVFRLFTVFQPGGPQERAQLLKEVSEDRLGASATAGDVLRALRLWRRNVARLRAGELHLQLPDPLVLTHVLTRWSEHVGRVGGQQVAYRVSTLRQALSLDQRPTLDQATEFAEALQAEAEQLLLASSSMSGGDGNRKKEAAAANAVKAAAVQAKWWPSWRWSQRSWRRSYHAETKVQVLTVGMALRSVEDVWIVLQKDIWSRTALLWKRRGWSRMETRRWRSLVAKEDQNPRTTPQRELANRFLPRMVEKELGIGRLHRHPRHQGVAMASRRRELRRKWTPRLS